MLGRKESAKAVLICDFIPSMTSMPQIEFRFRSRWTEFGTVGLSKTVGFAATADLVYSQRCSLVGQQNAFISTGRVHACDRWKWTSGLMKGFWPSAQQAAEETLIAEILLQLLRREAHIEASCCTEHPHSQSGPRKLGGAVLG